jgi:ribosomal protein L37AE/L43A
MLSGFNVRTKEENHQISNPGVYICEECNSHHVTLDSQGYTCRNCGLVLSGLNMTSDFNQNSQSNHYTPLNGTRIGLKKERIVSGRSIQLELMDRLDRKRSYEEEIKQEAREEIIRILSAMNLSLTHADAIFKKFWHIYSLLQPGTKYRSVEKLVPICLYLHLKMEWIVIQKEELLNVSKISTKDFRTFLLQLGQYLPNYYTRNRKKMVLRSIWNCCEEFDLGLDFYYRARKIVMHFWEPFKTTKDSVIAAVCVSLAILSDIHPVIKVARTCTHFGCSMSTVHRQIENKLFTQYHAKDFESLVSSSTLIRRLMIKLGIIKVEDDKAKLKSKIHLKLGGAVDIFNAVEVGSQAYYLVFMKIIKPRDSITFILLIIEVRTHFESALLLEGNGFVFFFLEVT